MQLNCEIPTGDTLKKVVTAFILQKEFCRSDTIGLLKFTFAALFLHAVGLFRNHAGKH